MQNRKETEEIMKKYHYSTFKIKHQEHAKVKINMKMGKMRKTKQKNNKRKEKLLK